MDLKRAIKTIRYCTLLTSKQRANYIRKHKIFGKIGKEVYLPFMILPLRCENIYLHNNIEIASGAKLIPHDAIHGVFSRMDESINCKGKNRREYKEHIGKIEIYDNVFIGANALIIGPCTIGPDVVVAGGAVVCSDIPKGSVVAGVPAKIVGDFYSLKNKRSTYTDKVS